MKYTDTYVKYYVIFIITLMSCEGQQVNTTNNDTQITSYPPIPKCCPSRTQMWRMQECVEMNETVSFTHFFYESNITHINTEFKEFELEFYHYSLNCPSKFADKFFLTGSDILGIIYNGSIIETIDWVLIAPSNYCVDSYKGTIAFVMCSEPEPISKGQIYFPCLIVSTLCYFFSAVVYQFILKVKDVHKKCFIGFCLSMGITFFCLILFQVVSTHCNILGSIFFLFILASFVWFCCLCLDMVFTVRRFLCEDMPYRIYLYIAASIMIPCFMLVISIIPTEIPDVPTSFMKEPGMCKFKGEEGTRIEILFVPMGLLLVVSLASIFYTFYLIRLKNKTYKSDIVWLEKKSHFKYRTYQCVVIMIIMTIFFVLALLLSIFGYMSDTFHKGMFFPLQLIDSLQGLLVSIVFVVHYFQRHIFIDMDRRTTNYELVELPQNGHIKARSCFMIWLTSSIWFIDAVLKNQTYGNPLVYEMIEGLQGIFTVAVFVMNRYTRKDIYKSLFGKEQKKADSKRFADLLEKFKTDKCDENKASTSNATEIDS